MNRIVIISAAFPPMNAPEGDHALGISRGLVEAGFEVFIATTKGSVQPKEPGIQVYPIMQDWSWKDLPRLLALLRQLSPDAILLVYLGWIYRFHPMVTFLPTLSKTLLPQACFVTQFENQFGSLPHHSSLMGRLFRKALERWAGPEGMSYEFGTLLRDSDRVIVLSNYHRGLLFSGFPRFRDKTVLIPPPPLLCMPPGNPSENRRQGRQRLGLAPDDFVLTYFGYIYPTKGVETLLRAFHLASEGRDNVRLVFLGGSIKHDSEPLYAERMCELARTLNIDKKVTWIGEFAWDSDRASFCLYASDVCVLPFDGGVYMHSSSFGTAAAHGLPVITTEGEMLEEPIVHMRNVYLCPPKDSAVMAAAIKSLMENRELRTRLAAGARDLADEWFSWDRAIERTIDTLSNSH